MSLFPNVWKAVSAGLGVALVAALIGLGVTTLQKNHITSERDDLNAALNAPVTGCRARLASTDAMLTHQSEELRRVSERSARQIAVAERGWAQAQAAAADARLRADRLSRGPAPGATVCERVQAVDKMVLEALR